MHGICLGEVLYFEDITGKMRPFSPGNPAPPSEKEGAGENIHGLFPEDDTAHRLLRARGKATGIVRNLSGMPNRGDHRISRTLV
jgi:hypothetical protein